jgi:uncharacterized protein DUF5591
MTEVRFDDIRSDWYKANQLLPRLVRSALRDAGSVRFLGFPRQWIPFFEYWGLAWDECRPPGEHMPVVSELSDTQLAESCRLAEMHGTLRSLVESVAVLDPVLADFLYILDNTRDCGPRLNAANSGNESRRIVRLTSWQSYGRPEIRQLEIEVDRIEAQKPIAVVLPCSRRRPYGASRTHRRIWLALEKLGIRPLSVHRVVVTSLGIIPEEMWTHPVVLAYDAGVPDIYRTIRLARRFFARNRYRKIVDCLQFVPYSDVLAILQREGIVRSLSRGPVSQSRQFYVKHFAPHETHRSNERE